MTVFNSTEIEIRLTSRRRSRSSDDAKLHFNLLFSRGRHKKYKVLQRTCTAIVLLIKLSVWLRSRCRRRRGLHKLPVQPIT